MCQLLLDLPRDGGSGAELMEDVCHLTDQLTLFLSIFAFKGSTLKSTYLNSTSDFTEDDPNTQ